ncbi:hypothetical protein [Halobaculum sp. P14]|uniref:hypothetical protein n=1 Tax=Halobaculum sp. P14 TaxID=3421638 RepID=UPI003EB92781
MSHNTLHDWIEEEVPPVDSLESHRRVADWFVDHGHEFGVNRNSWPRTSTIEEETDHLRDTGVYTVLSNLTEIDLLAINKGADTGYVMNHRTVEQFHEIREREWVPVLDDEIDRFLGSVSPERGVGVATDGGPTPAAIALDAVDQDGASVARVLTNEDSDFERLKLYDTMVAAIQDSDEVEKTEEYGAMGFRSRPNKYALSEVATRVAKNSSLLDFS